LEKFKNKSNKKGKIALIQYKVFIITDFILILPNE